MDTSGCTEKCPHPIYLFYLSASALLATVMAYVKDTPHNNIAKKARVTNSSVTRGVAHPWKVWGKFRRKGEMRKKGRKREKGEGRGKKRRKRQARKKGKMERKKGKIVKGDEENLKWKAERVKMSRGPFSFFFFCLSLFETTEICLGCTKMDIFWGNFLTSPTFDCIPGYAPGHIHILFLECR